MYWAPGKVLFPGIEWNSLSIWLISPLSTDGTNKANVIRLEGFTQNHMLYFVAITHNFCHTDQILTAE